MAHKKMPRPARGVDTRAAMDGTIVQKDLKIRIILYALSFPPGAGARFGDTQCSTVIYGSRFQSRGFSFCSGQQSWPSLRKPVPGLPHRSSSTRGGSEDVGPPHIRHFGLTSRINIPDSEERTVPVTPRRGVARLYQSDLRPPAAGTALFFHAISILDAKSPACAVARKRGHLGAGKGARCQRTN